MANSRVATYIIYGSSLTDIDNKFKERSDQSLTNHNILSATITDHSNGMCAVITVWQTPDKPFKESL